MEGMRLRNVLWIFTFCTLSLFILYTKTKNETNFEPTPARMDVQFITTQQKLVGLNLSSQHHRRSNVQESCRNSLIPRYHNSPYRSGRLFLDKKRNILYCLPPKAGSTGFLNGLMALMGSTEVYKKECMKTRSERLCIQHLQNPDVSSQIGLLRPLKGKNITFKNFIEGLGNRYKVILVRNPVLRLVSAYQTQIQIHNTIRLQVNHTISFTEYLTYIKNKINTRQRIEDGHTKTISDLCRPCDIKYDYIITQETLYDDVQHIINNFYNSSIKARDVFLRTNGPHTEERNLTSTEKFAKEAYKHLPQHLKRTVRDYVAEDASLFGYNIKPWL